MTIAQELREALDNLTPAEAAQMPEHLQTLLKEMLESAERIFEAPAPAKRPRGPRRPAPAIVAKESEHRHVRADKFNQEIAKMLQSKNGYDIGVRQRFVQIWAICSERPSNLR